MDWQAIDDVFLDMDGTLLDLHFDNYFWLEHLPVRYSQINGSCEQQVRRDIESRTRALRGQLDWYCLETWQRHLGLDIMALKREVADKIRFRPEVPEFLSWLRASGKRVSLVTNAHQWGIDLKFEQLGMAESFDWVFSSHDFRLPKEQPEFWRQLSTTLVYDPERTLFIDDNEQVLESAQQFGIRHLLGVLWPDSQRGPQPSTVFSQVASFAELTMGGDEQ